MRRGPTAGLPAANACSGRFPIARMHFTPPRIAPPASLERMPKWLICVPLVAQWLWLSLLYRSATLPSAANPHITSGGMVGEGKLEYFRGMGEVARRATAKHAGLRTDRTYSAGMLQAVLDAAALVFPL